MKVTEVTPLGVVRPLDGATVWLVGAVTKPTAHGPQSQTVGRWPAVTDDDGSAFWPRVKRVDKATYQAVIAFQGVSYRSKEFKATGLPPAELKVYHVVPAPSADVTLKVHWTVDVGEVSLRVNQIVRVENESLTTVDYVHAPLGLRMPTFSHTLLDGRAVTHGIFPPGRVHGAQPPSLGQGHLVGEKGAVVFRGPVPPGAGLFFQFSYHVPFARETTQLTAVSDLDLSDAAVTVRWTDRVTPRARLLQPHRSVRQAREGMIRTDMLVRGRQLAGAPIVLRFERLPVQTKLPRWVAGVGSVGGFGLFLLVLVGALWKRSRS